MGTENKSAVVRAGHREGLIKGSACGMQGDGAGFAELPQ